MHGLHPLNVDADVLEMAKYVKDYKIILVYVEHKSSNVDLSIFVSPKKGVAITIDNHLTKALIEIDSSPDVNKNLTPMCHMNLTKEWEQSADPLEDLDEILEDYENTRDEITGKQMVVHVGNSSTFDDVLDLHMLFKTEGVGPIGKFKEVEHDEVFDDDEHIVKDVHMSRVRKRSVETRRKLILVKNDKERVRVRCEGTISALVPYVASDTDMGTNVFSQTKGGPVIRENNISGKQNILGKDKIVHVKGKKVNKQKKKTNTHVLGQCLLHTLMKADGRFLSDHVIKTLATNPDIPVRAVQDQMQKQFDVGRGVCVFSKQGFKACGREILGLDGCFMSCPWPGQILTAVGVNANNGIYPVAYVIVEAESKREMWPVVESTTVIIPPNHKSQVGIPPKKWKKSHDEIISQSCSSGKLSRKGRLVKCSKCGKLGHNMKGYRGQGGASQAGGSSQAGARQDAGARNVSGQAAGSRNASS
ncbi:hypothetical protein Tco_1523793 [Tanacetum coccineum]